MLEEISFSQRLTEMQNYAVSYTSKMEGIRVPGICTFGGLTKLVVPRSTLTCFLVKQVILKCPVISASAQEICPD